MKKKQKYSNFCFCLGLRPGVIISSVLWILEGIFFSSLLIKTSIKFDDGEKKILQSLYNIGHLSLVLSSYFVILTLIIIFGFASLLLSKLPLMRLYSRILWFYAVFIYLVLAIVSFIAIAVESMEPCNGVKDYDACANPIKFQLVYLFFVLFFQGSQHVYFSIILRAYIDRCEQMRKKQKRKVRSSKRVDSSNLFNIKVDKTFDDRIV